MGSPLRGLYESGRGEVYGYDEFGRLTVPKFEDAEGAGSEVGVGFAAVVAAGYNFIGAYDDEGYRIGEGGMFYIGGGAEFPILDGHEGVTDSKSIIRPIMEALANKD